MTPRRAIEFLLDSACHNHRWECGCVENGRINNELSCSCGATKHNKDVVAAIIALKRGYAEATITFDVGIESPTFKFDDEV